MSWTTEQLDIVINKAHLRLAEIGWEIMEEEDVGHYPLAHYLASRYISSAIEALETDNDFTDKEIESIVSCLRKHGIETFEFTELSIVSNSYNDNLQVGLIGPAGADGPAGATGSPGSAGADGAAGPQGAGYGGTSSSAYIIGKSGTGFSMTLSPKISVDGYGLAYQAGDLIQLTDNTRANTYIVLAVDAFNATTGVLNFDDTDYDHCFVTGTERVIPDATGYGSSSNWTVGIAGTRGTIGVDGATGAAGARGGKWTTGAGTPSTGGSEVDGDMYLNTSNGDVYRHNGTIWGSVVDNITGPPGSIGPTGPAGASSLLISQLAEHDVTGAAYSLTGSNATISNLSITLAGSSSGAEGTCFIWVTMTFRNAATSTDAEFGIYVNSTLVNTNDTTEHQHHWEQAAFDTYMTHTVSIATYTTAADGDVITVKGNNTSGDADLLAGNLLVFRQS
jgi:hypothetical protein